MAKVKTAGAVGLGRTQNVGKSLYVRMPPTIVQGAALRSAQDVAINTDGKLIWFRVVDLNTLAPPRPTALKRKAHTKARAVKTPKESGGAE